MLLKTSPRSPPSLRSISHHKLATHTAAINKLKRVDAQRVAVLMRCRHMARVYPRPGHLTVEEGRFDRGRVIAGIVLTSGQGVSVPEASGCATPVRDRLRPLAQAFATRSERRGTRG